MNVDNVQFPPGLIPHEQPCLLVDGVLEVDIGRSIICTKYMHPDNRVFAGHFPGNPVMPATSLLEAMAQACALMIQVGREDTGARPPSVALVSIDGARFTHPVKPDDTITIKAERMSTSTVVFRFKAAVWVKNVLVARAELICAIGEKNDCSA